MWTIPDKGEGQDNRQSTMFQEYLDVLVDGIRGLNCVLSGCDVTAQGSPDMTCAVAKGAILTNGILKPITAGNVTITTADSTYPRIDLVVADSSAVKTVRAGTPAAHPKPPARSTNDVVLAYVWVPAGDTTISSNQIVDLRVLRDHGSVVLYRTTTPEATNNTSGAIEALDKANSGVSIPAGLFLNKRILRVRLGGNMLLNNGSPTVRFAVLFGGTTMYSDISGAGTADTDRRAWFVDFDIVAQASNDQSVIGHAQFQDPGTIATAPTTGIGDVWGVASVGEGPTPFTGSSAVDADAADRKIQVQITFSVANANNELVVESASVELI
jgi:hypothetical protein